MHCVVQSLPNDGEAFRLLDNWHSISVMGQTEREKESESELERERERGGLSSFVKKLKLEL